MDLIVVRHAIAEEPRAGLTDARRALTARGRRRMRAAVGGLKRLGLRLDRIQHSPLRRAAQTAELLRPLLRGDGACTLCAELAREPSPALLDELRGALHGACVAVVGHEPWTGELVAWLVLGTMEGASGFALRKGGVAWLRGKPEPGGMRVVALLAPSVLRRLGRE
jgi:phosphohistidine phosphatase